MVYSKDHADSAKNTVEQKDDKAPEFVIQRLYVKDLSIETPNSPHIFLENWEPELSMDLQTKSNALGDNAHEVILTITVTVKIKDKTAFLVEAKQAGVFTIANFPVDQLHPMLGSFCPNILYPYVREVVTDAVVKAGFPQLYLMPVNFDALYEQNKQEDKK